MPNQLYTPGFFSVGDSIEHRFVSGDGVVRRGGFGLGTVLAVEPGAHWSEVITVRLDSGEVKRLGVSIKPA